MTCWAAVIGDCAGKLSGEHLVSENLWTGPTVHVEGLPWCKGETKAVGVGSLTANILCTRHNSLLSPVDQAGGDTFRVLREAALWTSARSAVPGDMWPHPWMVRWFGFDGPLLERWFLKTMINLVVSSMPETVWALTGTSGSVPPLLVRAAYGREPLPRPLGLYVAGRIGDQWEAVDGVVFWPVWTAAHQLSGALFSFLGHRFVFHAESRPLPAIESEHGRLEQGDMFYHLLRFNNDVGGRRSHVIDLRWPERAVDHFNLVTA